MTNEEAYEALKELTDILIANGLKEAVGAALEGENNRDTDLDDLDDASLLDYYIEQAQINNYNKARSMLFEVVAAAKKYLKDVQNIPRSYEDAMEKVYSNTVLNYVAPEVKIRKGEQDIDVIGWIRQQNLDKVINALNELQQQIKEQ